MADINEWLAKQPSYIQALAREFPLNCELDAGGIPVYVIGWNHPALIVSPIPYRQGSHQEALAAATTVLARRMRGRERTARRLKHVTTPLRRLVLGALLALFTAVDCLRDARGGGQSTPFVNAWDHPQVGSLRYNTCQQGSPIPIIYGCQRCTLNLIEGFNFSNKSKGTKGGKGLGSVGGKKGSNADYSVFVAFAFCQGPIQLTGSPEGFVNGSTLENRAWSNGNVIGVDSIFGITALLGNDGQTPDSTWTGSDPNSPVLGYSGTFVAFGEPLELGSTPALPDFSVEVIGFLPDGSFSGALGDGSEFSADANPSGIIYDLLTNSRYGAGFPAAKIDHTVSFANYATYCQAATLPMSLILDKQQPAARWIEEILQLTVSDAVWTDGLLKIFPYGDQTLTANGATFTPNLTWEYSFTDEDYIRESNTDPVVITRSDPSLATNWLSLEYMDSANNFNPTILPVWDQGLIDDFGVRTEPPIQAHEFTHPECAQVSAQLQLQRKAYVRNKYKFKVNWKASLLEPMDIVVLTDSVLGISQAAVRIIEIEENDNGELSMTAEEIPGVTP